MAISQQQFDTDLAKLGTDVATLINEVNLLIAIIQKNQGVDLTTEDNGVNSMDSSVGTSIAAAKAVTGQ